MSKSMLLVGTRKGLFVLDSDDLDLLEEDSLRRLSAGGDLVVASVEEHVMASLAQGWKDGSQIWSLWHQSDKGIEHLEEIGTPPTGFAEIKKRAYDRQRAKDSKDVDYIFDIPLSVAQSITGFKHDEGGPDEFEVLERQKPSLPEKRGFWNRLFGKG